MSKPTDRVVPTARPEVFLMHSKNKTGVRKHLLKLIDGRCYWCRRKMNLKKERPNTATVDHLYSKRDALRKIGNNARVIVLACNPCNLARSAIEEEMLNPERILERGFNRNNGMPAKAACMLGMRPLDHSHPH